MNPWDDFTESPDAADGHPAADFLIDQARAGLSRQPFTPTAADRARLVAQGVSFGFGDEIEAGARQLIPGGGDYRTVRDDLRQRNDQFRAARTGQALGLELAGAAAPTAALALTGVGAPGAAAANVSTAARVANAGARLAAMGAAEGALAGAGYSDADDFSGVMRDTATGAAVGAVASPVAGTALHSAGRAAALPANVLLDWTRRAFGDLPASAVEAEVRRLAQGTNKTPDEIVQDALNGVAMGENQTMAAVLRAYRSQGGEAADTINRNVRGIRDSRRKGASGVLSSQLNGALDPNAYRVFTATDDTLRAGENALYQTAFDASNADPSPQLIDTLTDVVQRMPAARKVLAEIYDNDTTITPLFKETADGAVEFYRMPTVRDAELARRALADSASSAYRAGSGTIGEVFDTAQKTLRSQIDQEFPDVADARNLARMRRSMRDLFADGRRAFSMNTDELAVQFENLQRTASPQELNAFRMGVADAVREQVRRSPTAFTRMADPTRKPGEVLRTVLPDMTPDQFEKLALAGNAEEMLNKVFHNSMTAPEQAARRAIGSRVSVDNLRSMATGNPLAFVEFAARKLASAMPQNLNDRQRAEVVRYLYTTDPSTLQRVLTGETAVSAVADQVAGALRYLGGVGRLGVTMQAAGGATNAN